MSTPGDPTPSQPSNPQKPNDFDVDKTLPEGAFDKTLPEGAFEDDKSAGGNDAETMVGDEPLAPNEGATMIGDDGDQTPVEEFDKTLPDGALAGPAAEDAGFAEKTMLTDDVPADANTADSAADDFGKTLPDSVPVLAEGTDAAQDFADKTIMMAVSEAAPTGAPDDDFGKTITDDAQAQAEESPADADKTLVVDNVASGADEVDEFGKTIQVDAFAATMTDDGSIVPYEDFDGKTIIGSDSAVEESAPPPKVPVAKTMALPGSDRDLGPVFKSRATRTGGLTSVEGTQPGSAQRGDGIDKDSLNVAIRTISGLQYGVIPRVDFKLIKQLGEGGMGVVYVAKQNSLGREVVFKTLKPMPESQASKLKASGSFQSVIKHRTDMFLSEAVVTADLYHPNIVPIYELAEAPDGSLFYTMKWVRGIGWHKRMKEMTLEENLEALMKVADAIAFAHSRHVVNRDLKPENVMLGEYGETIVLDWGLALPFGEGKNRLPLATTAGLGSGTPAYMPPELITGPLNKIGPACDIYLLGAILFEIVTGQPPHEFTASQSKTASAGAKMAEIRRVVVENIIRDTGHTGELIDIARKAMATKAEDRYRSVVEFQNAIRDYQKHAASRTLAERARELTAGVAPVVAEAKPSAHAPTVGYTNYQNALALYNESLREWPGNHEARVGLTETQLNFAKLALAKGDFDLGLSVLDTNAESHTQTRNLLIKARQERENRVRVMKVLKVAAAVLIVAVIGLLAVAARFQFNLQAAQKALVAANDAKAQAEKDKADAERAQHEAELATHKAREDLKKAELAQRKAEEDLKIADLAKRKAEEETQKAEADLKVANAAKQKAEEETKKAEANLKIAEQAKKKAEEDTEKAKVALAAANAAKAKADEERNKASYLAGLAVANRLVQEGRYPDARRKLEQLKKDFSDRCKAEWDQLWNTVNAPQAVSLSKPVESVDRSRDGRKLVAGDNTGQIVVFAIDADGKLSTEPIRQFQLGARPRAVAMSPEGEAVAAAGEDRRILIWSLAAERPPIELKGHDGAINTLKFSADGKYLASGSDDRTMRLWSLADARELVRKKVMYAVQSVDWSRDGTRLVAGTSAPADVSGVAYAWEVRQNDTEWELLPLRTFQVPPSEDDKVKQDRGVVAIALSDDGQFAVSNGPAAELHLWRVDLRGLDLPKKGQKVNVESIKLGLHSTRVERVRSVAFSADGSQLLASGDDGTISIWKRRDQQPLPTFERVQVLYGHGGPVRRCLSLPQGPDLLVSGGYDQNVHVWDVKRYLESREWLEDPDKAAKDDGEPKPASAYRVPPVDSDRAEDVATHQPVAPPSSSTATLSPFRFAAREATDELSSRAEFGLANLPADEAVPRDVVPVAAKQEAAAPTKSVQIVTGHTDSVLSAVFSRDGRRVLSASRDQTARAWISANGQPVRTFAGQAAVFDDNVFAEGHEYDLFTMRFFPNGQRLLTSGFDGTMRIWDARLDDDQSFGRELVTLPETGMYGVVDISRDGEWILTAGRRNSAQLWKTQTVLNSRRPKPDLVLDGAHRYRVTTVAVSPDSGKLLTADREGVIVFWDAKSGRVIGRQRNAHIGEVVRAEFLGDGSRLLTAGVDRRVVLWNVVDTDSGLRLERVRQFDHEGMVVNLAVSSRGDRFISVIRRGVQRSKASEDTDSMTKVSLWRLDTGMEEVIRLNRTAAASITESARAPVPAWAANGTLAVITTPDGQLYFFDSEALRITETWKVDDRQHGARQALPFAALLRPDEPTPQHVLTQTHNAAYLWRLKDGANLVSFRPQGPVFSAAYSSDGRFVVTGGRSVRIFDADEQHLTFARPLHKIENPHQGIVTSVEFSPAPGSYRFFTTSYDETAKLWEWLPDRQVARLLHELTGHEGPLRGGAWSTDGSRLLTVGHDARPRVWSFPDNAPPKSVVLELPPPRADNPDANAAEQNFDQLCGTFSWDGNFVAIGGRDVTTGESIGWVWNLSPAPDKGPVLHATIRGHGLGGINSVAFLPGDDRLLTGGTDGTARLWDWQKEAVGSNPDSVLAADFLITLVRPGEATTHRGAVTSVRVTETGNIVTASSDGTVLIWPK